MAVTHDHHPELSHHIAGKEQNRCALMFVLTWAGFFAVIGGVAWLMSAI